MNSGVGDEQLSQFIGAVFFTVQLSHPYMTTGKNIALTRWTFVGKVISLLFDMLSRLVITFLPRSKCLLISWLQSPSAVILEPKKINPVLRFMGSQSRTRLSDGTELMVNLPHCVKDTFPVSFTFYLRVCVCVRACV